ncbi:MAG: arsenic resistance protein, partial [Bacteroidetes bacterium]|nr:arsenic resistance protein [Bacteroidota bacterium]
MNKMSKETHLSTFEKYLALWVVICMAIGIIFSLYLPALGQAFDAWQIRGISVPIGILLFFMMYPALLNVQIKELKKLMQNPKPILLTTISNWIVAPIVTAYLAKYFLAGYDQLIVAAILLGSSPCTAMVLVWGSISEGNQEQNIINTSLNTITIIVLYVPVVSFLTGIQNIQIDQGMLVLSLFVFIGLPMIVGYISKKYLVANRGEMWFNETYRPAMGKVSIIALLTTLIVLFSMNGEVLLNNPDLMVKMSIPLLVGFVVVVGYNLVVTRLVGLAYPEAITSVIIGSSSHFEIAIATAISLYG